MLSRVPFAYKAGVQPAKEICLDVRTEKELTCPLSYLAMPDCLLMKFFPMPGSVPELEPG